MKMGGSKMLSGKKEKFMALPSIFTRMDLTQYVSTMRESI